MEHTYLRYECADAFALTTSSASSKAPPSNSTLGFASASSPSHPIVLTTAASYIMGFHLKQSTACLKLGHREQLLGGVGTGRALNSDEVVCLSVSGDKVASGWVDGAVRVFDVQEHEVHNRKGLFHSLIHDNGDEDFVMREPLVLNGHTSAVRSLCWDAGGTRLASGGNDGSVVLWDTVAETGLFRLLGHRGSITDISFVNLDRFDGLATASLDGLVKVWDLDGQCCTQTIANHRGEVWASACNRLFENNSANEPRWRLITGGTDGQVRVWSVKPPRRLTAKHSIVPESGETLTDPKSAVDDLPQPGDDDVCHYMGSLNPPPNVSTSNEKISTIHYHPNGRYVAILHANSKNIDVYLVRGTEESVKKKQRRYRRRREKKGKLLEEASTTILRGKKREHHGLLDDPESSADENDAVFNENPEKELLNHESTRASDEFEYYGTARAAHKVRGFSFVPFKEKGAGLRIVCSLSTNALEVISLIKRKPEDKSDRKVVSEKVSLLDMQGHPTGIRSIALSSDDELACTVSKNEMKVWNTASRSCIQSVAPSDVTTGKKTTVACYCLCASFLPGNTHVVLGSREGHLFVIDIASGDIVHWEEAAHSGAIWSIDVRCPTEAQPSIAVLSGSADKTVKFWNVEAQDDEGDEGVAGHPMLVHTRTLAMSDAVVAVRYSHTTDPAKRMVFVSTLDSTIKIFFDDSLKFFLSLYGHKLPALAVDASDDDTILASSGADKTVKIWGLDFGDTHRSLHGHQDSITDLRFVKRTHNFFTASKDGTVRYWDGDRFKQILLLTGHCAEVNCLAISRTGAFVLSGGMDRQVRVWERTKDIVFLEEERERELEGRFDAVAANREGRTTASLIRQTNASAIDSDGEDIDGDAALPQSESAVKRSVLSVSSGDRIIECIERADQEMKDTAMFRKSQGGEGKHRTPNPLLLGLEPPVFVLWVLRSVKSAELEQSLLVLPLGHMERLIYYLIVLLNSGRGIELCSRVAIFLVRIHQNQLVATRTLVTPLHELRRLLRMRLAEARDTIGFNMAALRTIAKVSHDRTAAFVVPEERKNISVWAGMGLGSDVAAVLEYRGSKKNRK